MLGTSGSGVREQEFLSLLELILSSSAPKNISMLTNFTSVLIFEVELNVDKDPVLHIICLSANTRSL